MTGIEARSGSPASDGGDPARNSLPGTHRDQHPRWSPDSTTVAFVSNRPAAGGETGRTARTHPPNPSTRSGRSGSMAVRRSSAPGTHMVPPRPPGRRTGQRSASSETTSPATGRSPLPLTRAASPTSASSSGSVTAATARGYIEKYSHVWIANLASGDERPTDVGRRVRPRSCLVARRGDDCVCKQPHRRQGPVLEPLGHLRGGCQRWRPASLTPDDARFSSPAWSPDGSQIAFSGHLGTDSATHTHIWTVNSDGSDLVDRTAGVDIGFGDSGMGDLANGSPEGPTWRDATTIQALASQRGETQVFAVDLDSGSVDAITSGTHRISGFAPIGSDLFVVRGMIDRPFAVERFASNGGFTTISRANDEILAEISLIDAIALDVTSPDGTPDPGLASSTIRVRSSLGGEASADPANPRWAALDVRLCHVPRDAAHGSQGLRRPLLRIHEGRPVMVEQFMSCTKGTWGESDMPDVIAAVDAASTLPWDRHRSARHHRRIVRRVPHQLDHRSRPPVQGRGHPAMRLELPLVCRHQRYRHDLRHYRVRRNAVERCRRSCFTTRRSVTWVKSRLHS